MFEARPGQPARASQEREGSAQLSRVKWPVMRVLKHGTLWTYRIALAVLLGTALLGATAYGAVRFWLLPNIDSYRPGISRAISQAARQHIEIGRIEGELDGLRPRLTLYDVRACTAFDRLVHELGEPGRPQAC